MSTDVSTGGASEQRADLDFYFDPTCPFSWMTSKWVRLVADQRAYSVDWRFLSLRLINEHVNYDKHFPGGYEDGHTAGLKLLRVAAAVRDRFGRTAVGSLYLAIGQRIFDTPHSGDSIPAAQFHGSSDFLRPILKEVGLPAELSDALEDASFDASLRAEADSALVLTGKDVGTPILHFRPPTGVAFFGPVISRLPTPEDAVPLWDNVLGLASFRGFAELKRSLRERPQLASFGVIAGSAGMEEDWHGGSRRTKG